jgi:hypothetical protein
MDRVAPGANRDTLANVRNSGRRWRATEPQQVPTSSPYGPQLPT